MIEKNLIQSFSGGIRARSWRTPRRIIADIQRRLNAELDRGHPGLRRMLLILYYLAIIAGLIVMYGRGDFSTPPFVVVFR
jgi:hypothetical protein